MITAGSAQAEAGNVKVVRGPWNEMWFDCLEGFPDATHDDLVDATSRAFNELLHPTPPPARSVNLPFMAR